jgi:hypothetical protein
MTPMPDLPPELTRWENEGGSTGCAPSRSGQSAGNSCRQAMDSRPRRPLRSGVNAGSIDLAAMGS